MHVRDDERLAQHLDHRDRRAHARLEAQLDATRRRGGEELRRPARDELLVRGHDVLAAGEQVEDIRPRRLEPAHHLGDDRDRRVVRDLRHVGREQAGGRVGVPGRVAHECLDNAQPVAGRALDVVGGRREQPVDGRADRAVPEQCDVRLDRHPANLENSGGR